MPQYDGSIKFEITVDSESGEVSLKRLGDKVKDTTKDTEGLTEEQKKQEEQTKKLADAHKAAALAVGAFATALVAAGVAAYNMSMEYEAAFAKTQTIMDTQAVAVDQMRADILDLSTSSAMAATDVSEAVYQAISGSVATADAVKFVEDANKLSVAGFTALTNATDVLTTTLNAYGLSADNVAGISNVLIQTQNLGKTSVDELSGSIGRAIATGSAYNVNLQNLASAYVELTRGGIATAEATTYLSGMLNELGKADSEVATIIREQTGKSFGELMADGKSLADVLDILLQSVDGNTEALMGLWGSQEAGKAANAIAKAGIADFNSVLADMDNQMAGAASTTDDAYNTMAQTSAFIDQRFSNSVTNLGIAVGDQLRPQFDAVKSALAGVFGWLTDLVTEHPIVVSALEGVAVAAGVLAVGMVVLSDAFASAIAKIKLAFASLMSHPLVLVTAAVVGLTTAIVSWAASSDDAADSVEVLTEKQEALTQSLEDGKAAMEDDIASANAAADVANTYIDRLEKLGAKTALTASEQAEYHGILVALCDIVPDLAQYIDLENDKLLVSTSELRDNTKAWRQNAEMRGRQDYLTALYRQQAEAEVELLRNRRQLKELMAKPIERDDNFFSWLFSSGASEEFLRTAEVEALKMAIEQGETAIAEASDLAMAYAMTYGIASEATEGYTEAAIKAAKATSDTSGLMGDASGVALSMADDYNAAADTLSQAWATANSNVAESVNGQIKLFADFGGALDAMASKTSTDTGKMIKALDSQLEYMDTYAQNMQKAAEMGVDEGLLASLNDGSVESAEILAGIVSGTEEQIAELNGKWHAVQEGKEIFEDELTNYSTAVKDAKDDMVELARQAGIEIPDKLTSGLVDGLSQFKRAVNRYSTAVTNMRRNAANKMASIGLPERGYATGTSSAAQGWALVGEDGPELVYLSGGESILPAPQTRSVLSAVDQARAVAATTPSYVEPVGHAWPGTATPTAGGGHITIEVPLSVDGREFARATAEHISEAIMYV